MEIPLSIVLNKTVTKIFPKMLNTAPKTIPKINILCSFGDGPICVYAIIFPN